MKEPVSGSIRRVGRSKGCENSNRCRLRAAPRRLVTECPQARCRRERDPRLSIEERYNSRAQYQRAVIDAATSLAKGGYLLTEDIDRVVEQALSNWDDITRGTTLAGK